MVHEKKKGILRDTDIQDLLVWKEAGVDVATHNLAAQNSGALTDLFGVHLHLTHSIFSIPKGIWTLSDSYSNQVHEPCIALQFSAAHLLHTSSPSSGRWKNWMEHLILWMFGRKLNFRRCCMSSIAYSVIH
jgi:hypothetical protein